MKSKWKRVLSILVLITAACNLLRGQVDGQGPVPARSAAERSRI
jgi:hypothetical protein